MFKKTFSEEKVASFGSPPLQSNYITNAATRGTKAKAKHLR